MSDVVIVDAVRTPLGRRNGLLKDYHPVTLGALVLQELVRRSGLDPAIIDQVLIGCVGQVGEQAINLARNVVLEADFPIEVPATTLDFQCGSSQQAVHLAAALIGSGQAEIVVAGGVESMTRVPIFANVEQGPGTPFTTKLMDKYNLVPQGLAAEEIAARWDVSRQEMDEIGYRSHMLASQALQAGRFKHEIMPLPVRTDAGEAMALDRDEGIRATTSIEKMATLKPAFLPTGRITAGNSSQISDGAAMVLLMQESTAQRLGLKPRARLVATMVVGVDPHTMLTGPIPATRKVLRRAGMRLDQIDLIEINEAFAAVIGIWQREIQPDMRRVNVHGGAIALGHPLGASGARLMTTLLNALETHDKRYGLQTMCCGGGLGTGTIIERLG
ncbi:MAG: thiolase family protein [Chloroflexi bacterium]|nr:thiolase family protein [Chloroflexota bacterium]